MGRRGKQRKFEFEDDEDELQGVKPGDLNSANSVSSDDEANEDLSLNVVEKALQLRAGMLVIDAGNNKDGNCEQDGNGDIVAIGAIELFSSSLEDADAEAGTSGASGDGITAASEGRELESEKTVKQRKTNVKNLGTEESNMVVTEGEKFETTGMIDQGVSVESNSTETTDNNVFRKLLRGPRYFDPPESWGTCYTCGEEGHNAVNCSSAKRKRSCFVCRSVEHNARSCSKNIQCYVCKKFGHLCCVDSTSDTTIVSCYKCGQTGHTGLSCSRLRGAVSPSTCYRCREEGHFARECTSTTKVGKRSRRLSNPKSMSQIEETNHMGSKSAPHDLAKAHNNEKKINHEDKTLTSLESQDKGSLGIK
ncbi:zinc finger CCHC domain-containing protein 7-like isoform X2 [Cucurbita maxima]|uniref:Zinc finger CCHC domain-containing protein 7-like isoform X2 n=1 Tax=Cucurbita maxima TaxID=3661 RepID=A0A6J1JHC2_CUCMA|nr:zinc finger CCHC domain-containing protein 7-like isoform X2 [Cucurbita maxima]